MRLWRGPEVELLSAVSSGARGAVSAVWGVAVQADPAVLGGARCCWLSSSPIASVLATQGVLTPVHLSLG